MYFYLLAQTKSCCNNLILFCESLGNKLVEQFRSFGVIQTVLTVQIMVQLKGFGILAK